MLDSSAAADTAPDCPEPECANLDKVALLTALTSLKKGDFSARLPLHLDGIDGKIAEAFNDVVELNQRLNGEFERVSLTVARKGQTSERVSLGDVSGSWRDSADSLNALITDLVHPMQETARVIGAVARGDLSQSVPLEFNGRPLAGEFLVSAQAVNKMVNQLARFTSEVTRVTREVGTEGKLGGKAKVAGLSGSWRDLTDSVNLMAGNLNAQVRNIATVTTAVAKGDLSKKITVDVRGEILELKNTINTMVDQLNSFASEVTRVAREVGTEGKLGGQADVQGVAGTWKDLTENVNSMAGNLTGQVRNIADVTKAVAAGDLSKKITVNVKGEILELKDTINTMVDQLNAFASEVTRMAREVGTEGKLGGQANVPGVAGIWEDLTDSVNSMAGNLTSQVRNIAEVTKAVAAGDLSKKVTVDVKGEISELKNTVNTMVDQLRSFASEVTRVAWEVGIEGKLGGQAEVQGVAGTWKDLTDSVNSMAVNLTAQVRNIADVTKAVATGDLSKKITVDVKGEILELKDTINTMVDQLNSFASEVTRVAREVGTEGKLGGQAVVQGVDGTWKDLTEGVNLMASNLTDQVRNIAEVTKAVAAGDLSKKVTVDVKGEISELKNTVNTMVDQLRSFASEVTRVAWEVGTEGKLGGQADVQGVDGTWKNLTECVNSMAGNLTSQVRNIADVTKAVAAGDLSKKITVDVKGEILELKDTINTMVDQLNSFASEVTRVAWEVGTEGKLGGQADVQGVDGTWKNLTECVNSMAGNLTSQVRNIAEVTKAVADGDLSRKITVDTKGEILQLKDTINTMVDQLRSFASEVTRVAREVGTEGKLGGQAVVGGVSGTWKDLTDNVNSMARNLTSQVRGIAKVVTAVANGDLKQKLAVEARGEIAQLADTINAMTSTLAIFAEQVTTMAREVGVEGKLGGQASVPGAAGTWRDLTDNVNQLAANLTTQVRAIADVATAVTKGDLTRSIQVVAEGEVAVLKDTINEMIWNLREQTLKNSEQNWLKTNLAKFSRMLQGQKDLLAVGKMILSELAPVVGAQQAVFYTMSGGGEGKHEQFLRMLASYAYSDDTKTEFRLGEGLIGQCALEGRKILLSNVPDDYLRIKTGLGEAIPKNVMVLPVLFEEQVKGVVELASFDQFSPTHEVFLEQLMETIGIVLNTIEANTLTEDLLKQSQTLAHELQCGQQELQNTNQELEEKARLLADQNVEVERKNREVEQARKALEEKAEQLALTSRYKSEFLANMSHELRTPLNSLLILSDQLARNSDGNLSGKQVDFCRTIHDSGGDLLALINDILDLSKIESGTVTVEVTDLQISELGDYVERNFRHVADSRKLSFAVELDPALPPVIRTDNKRLQQILKNLLSNAFKFTSKGSVTVRIFKAAEGWNPETNTLSASSGVVGISVTDTGIGIHPEKQRIIFEAFQQEDGGTSRRYGGTGLGLAISREISLLLGGEIRVASESGRGSTFTLYLPEEFSGAKYLQATPVAPPPPVTESAPAPARLQLSELPDEFGDDRATAAAGDRSVLIIDNDVGFGKFLQDLARERGYKTLATMQGSVAIALAREFEPWAVLLDIRLPDVDGWRVLAHLKRNSVTRHIPVHVISTEDHSDRAPVLGAYGAIQKPISRATLENLLDFVEQEHEKRQRTLVVLEDESLLLGELSELMGSAPVKLITTSSPAEFADAIESKNADCALASANGNLNKVIKQLSKLNLDSYGHLPVVLYAPDPPEKLESSGLRRLRGAYCCKVAPDLAALFNELTLALHLPVHSLADSGQALLQPIYRQDVFKGKKVLVVDDDIRNIFAMTSILERQEMVVFAAENGRDAINLLMKTPEVDVVLMDIMMPEMDGYETMRAIRKTKEFDSLPIIALTAKAMKGDREKCIEAGASDYIAKPVDTEQLFSILQGWLCPVEGPPILL